MLKKRVITAVYIANPHTTSLLLTQNVSYELDAKFMEVMWHFILFIITGHYASPKCVCVSMAQHKLNIGV